MIRIGSESQLLETFRPIDRDQVQIPAKFKFPFLIKDCLSWVEPSGHRTYLVFREEFTNDARGIVFERARFPADAAASMCQWCHSVRKNGAVALMTASVSRDRRVGLYLCADLKCKDHILGLPGVNDLNESSALSRKERVERVIAKMTSFATQNLNPSA